MRFFTLFSERKTALFISINASGKNENTFSQHPCVHVNRWGRWKENISHGAKIPRDPWKILSSFGLFSKCFMASSLNDLTLSFRSSGHDARKVMRQAWYLPEMSLPILSLKLLNYTGQEPAYGITTTPRLPVNPTLLLIALFHRFIFQPSTDSHRDWRRF